MTKTTMPHPQDDAYMPAVDQADNCLAAGMTDEAIAHATIAIATNTEHLTELGVRTASALERIAAALERLAPAPGPTS